MSFLKPLLAVLIAVFALFAGLITAAVVAVTAVALFLTRRLLRRGVAGGSRQPVPSAPPRRAAAHPEAIDVVATEVPAERLPK